MKNAAAAKRAFAVFKRRVLDGKDIETVAFAWEVWLTAWLQASQHAADCADTRELMAGLSSVQRRQFTYISRTLADLPVGARRLFWGTPKGSLGGATPLSALVVGRYAEVLAAAKGFAVR